MRISQQQLEEYLDGQVSAAERTELERTLTTDDQSRQSLTQLRQHRQLREAALASYAPTADEAAAMAATCLATLRERELEPIGRISPPTGVRRWQAVAAGLAIAVAAFGLGRISRPVPATDNGGTAVATIDKYVVNVKDVHGQVIQQREFASLTEARAFANQQLTQINSNLATAEEASASDETGLASMGSF